MKWYAVEFYCPTCGDWRDTGTTTTRENFESGDPFIIGAGKFILPCGHEVMADDYESRLGAEIEGPDSSG
jgi:hypothetical protein